MDFLFLASGFAEGTQFVQEKAAEVIPLPVEYIIPAIILIVISIFVFFFLKKIIINSILGVVVWAGVTFLFNMNLPLLPSLVVSIVFGPAGIGVMFVLKVFGLI